MWIENTFLREPSFSFTHSTDEKAVVPKAESNWRGIAGMPMFLVGAVQHIEKLAMLVDLFHVQTRGLNETKI